MNRLLITVLILALVSSTSAQADSWIRTYGLGGGEFVHDVRPTADGGCVMVGVTLAPGRNNDLWVVKIDAGGEIEWSHILGRPSSEHAPSIDQVADGSYVVTARTEQSGNYYSWLVRLDQDGALLQQLIVPGSDGGSNEPSRARRLRDGGWLVTFTTRGRDPWLLRFRSDGSLAWGQRLHADDVSARLWDVLEADDGSIVGCGYWRPDAGSSVQGPWIVRLDAAGAVLWQRAYAGDLNLGQLGSIDQHPDGGFIASGRPDTRDASDELLVLRVDDAGSVLWQETLGGPADESDARVIARPGGAVVGGTTRSFGSGVYNAMLLWIDDGGSITRQHVIGDDGFASLTSLPDGSFLAASRVYSPSDALLLRSDASGAMWDGCEFVTESHAVATATVPIVHDTHAESIPTGALFLPADGIRAPYPFRAELHCIAPSFRLDADIQPGGCPNPLNLNRRGVIPAALTTHAPADALRVDLASVQLEGVPARRCVIDDVSAPWDDATSCCGAPPPDGLPDVVCHFDAQAVALALCERRAPPPREGETLELALTARTLEGGLLSASDCVRIQTFGCSTVPSPPGRSDRLRVPLRR